MQIITFLICFLAFAAEEQKKTPAQEWIKKRNEIVQKIELEEKSL